MAEPNLLVQPVERLAELIQRPFGANDFSVLFRDFSGPSPLRDPPLRTVQMAEHAIQVFGTRTWEEL